MKIQLTLLSLALLALTGAGVASAADQAGETLPAVDQRFAQADAQEDPSFQRHVLPLMGRLGCNGRSCHGSFQGRGGFQLSLFGYDFAADHKALLAGDVPRVNPADVDASLILVKPTSDDEHEGGQRYEKGSWQHHLLRKWVASGAKDDGHKVGKLVRVEVTPAEILFHKAGEQVTLQAIAIWDDGTREIVTPICRFQTNDESIAEIDEQGVVTAKSEGDTHVVVFYDNGITPVPVLRPVSEQVAANYPKVETPTKIDELVVQKLRKLGVVPSGLASDAEFLRRATIDITGTLPTTSEVEAFLADKSPNKRAEKIDELLDRPGHAAWWATRLSDLTGNTAENASNNSFRDEEARQWYEWLYRRVADNTPYDQLVVGIVTATTRRPGQSYEEFCKEYGTYFQGSDPADFGDHPTLPHFWTRRSVVRMPEERALSFAYAFLGVRLQCAQCHKHPFDQWSKQDFENFQVFFTGMQYGTPNEDQDEYAKLLKKSGLDGNIKGNDLRKKLPELLKEGKAIPFDELFVSFERPNRGNRRARPAPRGRDEKEPPVKTISATMLGGQQVEFTTKDDPRQLLMDWLKKKDNRFFASSFVNRVWANYFNVGIIEPPDDMSLANPASNEPLLAYLADEFVAHNYDMKWLHRTIANSRTYQLSWETNETNRLDARNFSHAVPRRLPAEVAYDALVFATAGDKEQTKLLDDFSTRAIGPTTGYRQRGNTGYALLTFGKPTRLTNCDCERSGETSLLQTLYVRNDGEVLRMIERRAGWIDTAAQQALGKNRNDEEENAAVIAKQGPELIRQLYLRTLSRQPDEQELGRAQEYLVEMKDLSAGLRDLTWALLNTKEFIVNH